MVAVAAVENAALRFASGEVMQPASVAVTPASTTTLQAPSVPKDPALRFQAINRMSSFETLSDAGPLRHIASQTPSPLASSIYCAQPSSIHCLYSETRAGGHGASGGILPLDTAP